MRQHVRHGGVQALQLVELEFQMAVRDQIIEDQRSAIGSLWNVLGQLASPERVQEIAAEQGIDMERAELQLQVRLERLACLRLRRRRDGALPGCWCAFECTRQGTGVAGGTAIVLRGQRERWQRVGSVCRVSRIGGCARYQCRRRSREARWAGAACSGAPCAPLWMMQVRRFAPRIPRRLQLLCRHGQIGRPSHRRGQLDQGKGASGMVPVWGLGSAAALMGGRGVYRVTPAGLARRQQRPRPPRQLRGKASGAGRANWLPGWPAVLALPSVGVKSGGGRRRRAVTAPGPQSGGPPSCRTARERGRG